MELVLKGGHYIKQKLILNSFSFEDKDPRFTRLKPGLAPRLHSKELFYIRAMPKVKPNVLWFCKQTISLNACLQKCALFQEIVIRNYL